MRYTCLVAILIALPVTADAQQRVAAGRGDRSAQTQARSGQAQGDRGHEQRQPEQRHADHRQNAQQDNQRQSGPPPTGFIGPIGLPPLAAQRMPWWEQRQIPAWEQKQTPWWEQKQTPSWERPAHPIYRPGLGRPPVYYPLPPYGYFFPFATYGYGVAPITTEAVTPPPLPETGFLRLEVEPRHLLQVFVDGLYVGTIADLGDAIELGLGPRRIELRAPGYRTLIFDTRIEFDRTVVYRGALDPIEEQQPVALQAPLAPVARDVPQAPSGSRIMYLIPGCYIGNVEPTAAMLRPGCDIGKLTTTKP